MFDAPPDKILPDTYKAVVVAEVEVELTVVKLVMVEVALATNKLPVAVILVTLERLKPEALILESQGVWEPDPPHAPQLKPPEPSLVKQVVADCEDGQVYAKPLSWVVPVAIKFATVKVPEKMPFP